jgi:hypothetical protein
MRTRKNNSDFVKVDMNYQQSLPIRDVAMRLGIHFDSHNKCFCPCPDCADHSSKTKGAGVDKKHNTIHCFVCNETWSPFTLVGMEIFGYHGRECFTAEAIPEIGKYISEQLGFGGASIEQEMPQKQDIPRMPVVTYINVDETTKRTPLYKLVGLSCNPFVPGRVHADDTQVSYEVSCKEAALIMSLKCLETLRTAYDFLAQDMEEKGVIGDRNYDTLRIELEKYLTNIYPFIDESDREYFMCNLAGQYLISDNEMFQMRLERMFPKEMDYLIDKMDITMERINSVEQELEEEVR